MWTKKKTPQKLEFIFVAIKNWRNEGRCFRCSFCLLSNFQNIWYLYLGAVTMAMVIYNCLDMSGISHLRSSNIAKASTFSRNRPVTTWPIVFQEIFGFSFTFLKQQFRNGAEIKPVLSNDYFEYQSEKHFPCLVSCNSKTIVSSQIMKRYSYTITSLSLSHALVLTPS